MRLENRRQSDIQKGRLGRTGVGLSVCLGLCSSCLAVWVYSGVSEFVLVNPLGLYLRSPLSFSLCSLGAPASGEGAHILYYGSIRWISYYY